MNGHSEARASIVAPRAAVVCMQLVHARDGADQRPATAAFQPEDVDSSKPSRLPSTARPTASATPSYRDRCLGPHGSSPASADGTAPETPNRQAQSPCIEVCNASIKSPAASGSKMCPPGSPNPPPQARRAVRGNFFGCNRGLGRLAQIAFSGRGTPFRSALAAVCDGAAVRRGRLYPSQIAIWFSKTRLRCSRTFPGQP